MARRRAIEAGETSFKEYKESHSNLEKMDLLDKAISQDDQAVYRARRAELKFHMNDYMGAQADANKWTKMMNREKIKTGQEKIKNHPLQSLLFTNYLWTNNTSAAQDCLTKHFGVDCPVY